MKGCSPEVAIAKGKGVVGQWPANLFISEFDGEQICGWRLAGDGDLNRRLSLVAQ